MKKTIWKRRIIIFLLVMIAIVVMSGCHVHKFVETVRKEAGCISQGYVIEKCNCGESRTTITSQPTGHNYEIVEEVPASCEEKGYTTEKCKVCGESRTNAIKPTGHNYEIVEEVTASCEEKGYKTGKCKVCGKTTRVEIPAQEHVFSLKTGICIKCGKSEKDLFEYIPSGYLLRNPDEYKGKRMYIGGRVFQIVSESTSSLEYSTYLIKSIDGQVYYVSIDTYGIGSRILENDWITIYGIYDGLYTYENVLNVQKTVPKVRAKYWE